MADEINKNKKTKRNKSSSTREDRITGLKKARASQTVEISNPPDGIRDKEDTKDNPVATNDHFLKGVRLYILPAGMMKVRVELFMSKLKLFGGDVEKDFDPQKCTHVLVDEDMTLKRALRLLKINESGKQPCSCPIVQSLWLSDCLKEKVLVPVDDYSLNEPPKSAANPSKSLMMGEPSSCRNKSTLEGKDQGLGISVTTNEFSSSPSKLILPKENRDSDSDYFPSDNDEGELFLESTPQTISSQANPSEPIPKELPKGNWICFQSSQKSSENNENQYIIDKLKEMVKTYKSTNDRWRLYSYQKAISALERFQKKITSWEEAKSIPGIGDSLADKIWEIMESGELRKLKEFQNSEDCQTLNLFTKVWGAGSQTARIWYQLGYRTLEDLKSKANLTSQQKIGLDHYYDLLERMSREEVAEIGKVITENTDQIIPGAVVETCGSYRRGKQTCGDVDFLISHPDGKSHQGILPKLLSALKEKSFITDDLIEIEESGNQKKYMGVCKLPGKDKKHRRIDIIVAPYSEYACALVHFTGSAHFNRSLRHLAKKMGMSLSEHSLRKGVIRSETEKLFKGIVLPTPTEESIFQLLGVPYRPPNERDH